MINLCLIRQRNKQSGFTLIEILIALAIFTIMSMMAYAGLAAVLDARASTLPRAEQLAQLQTTLYLLNEDINQAINRPVRDELGSNEAALGLGKGNEVLVLTRIVPDWTSDSVTHKLQRVSYRLEAGVLYRRVYDVLDRTQKTTYTSKKLLKTSVFTLKQYNKKSQNWEPFNGGANAGALDVSVNLESLGVIHRSFLLHS